MNCKDISSSLFNTSIDIQSVYVAGFTFPAGSTTNTENLKIIDGKKEGQLKILSPKGIVLAKLKYHADLLEGLCILKNEKGQKVKECVFEKGKMNGYVCEYKNYSPVFTGIYRDGKKYSELKDYENNNEFMEEVKDGKRIGIWKFTDKLTFEEGICCCYKKDVITQVYHYKCGKENRLLYKFENDQMIQYDENDNIIYCGGYDGDFINGFNQVSNIKMLYDDDSKLIYKGDYDANTFEKKGKGWRYEYENDRLVYVFVCENGNDVYKWIDIQENGTLKEYDKNGMLVYEGEYERNTFQHDGEGDLYSDNKIVYSGKWKSGKKDGYGILYENGSVIYDGEWKDDKENGYGKSFDSDDNLIYDGEWKDGNPYGNGKYYVKGKMNCYVVLFENGSIVYKGEWKDNKPHGIGEYFESGLMKYSGRWNHGTFDIDENNVFDYLNKRVIRTMRITTGEELLSLLNNEEMKRDINKMIIEKGCGNGLEMDLKICGFANLQVITVEEDSLMNLNSLVISNNNELKYIQIKKGCQWDSERKTSHAPFEKVRNVEISSKYI